MNAWLFDLGNTRLKCAPLRADGRPGPALALPHREEDIAAALAQALPRERIDVAYLASVAHPAQRMAVLQALSERCARISIARTQTRFALPGFGEVRIAYAEPRKLGVDRFLALLGAHAQGQGAALICGVGTALTIDLIDARGQHHGGLIAPSPTLMREALHARAPQLPELGGERMAFAADTEDALASGCDGAALALIERSLLAGKLKLGAVPRLLLHGGGSDALAAALPTPIASPTLVLEGLAIWAGVETPR
ncbi:MULTISPECIES: type III pantothenate kinase [unclassified Lysobacter]|uniref:type III pantothenate kinase n=1 Tax=unclassified Lysobacter TaxID=2635362 RepID=UPI001BE75013|nr:MULTISPECIES: type III pantothenate kinase [unclassified Lysobacter]MBT2745631.1 type III pantothenate kinase [Lysobacter sp. ISL-42]MBT2753570.1 type III pantothenate kinase [Lysobacter sp. ISL-50]MBT2777046.1 type III pantothenate kinase [Lysobacter sp. ISL-54]MBT2780328.1 type III pantothenate kinase [Lysobacter sp. ISL-52]